MLEEYPGMVERKKLEEQVRLQHRKRIDTYHQNVADDKYYQENVLKGDKVRARAAGVREEAERV